LGKKKEAMNTVKRRKLEHIMRNDTKFKLLNSILQGKVFGKREEPEEEGYHVSRT
jgi:hypothetical protein